MKPRANIEVLATKLDPRITLRPMTLMDVALLDRWDRQPHVIAATSDDPDQPKAFGDTYWPDELALTGPDNRCFIGEEGLGPLLGCAGLVQPDCLHRGSTLEIWWISLRALSAF